MQTRNRWIRILCLGLAFAYTVLPLTAWPDSKRIALVIGNAAYQHIEKLRNPARDAQAVAERLRRLGFTLLHPVRSEDAQTDLSLDELLRADEALEQAAQGADIALLYYAGHGIHGIKGDNQSYVLPVDVPKIDAGLLQSKAGREGWERRLMKLDDLVGGLEGRAGVTLAIFDACREIPELEQATRSISASGISPFRGLARLDLPAGRRILAYSSAVGKTALDGEGEHSPYTAALLAEIDRDPSQDVRDLFDRVASTVGSKIGQPLEVNHQGVAPDTYFLASPSAAAVDKLPALNNPIVTNADKLPQQTVATQQEHTTVASPISKPNLENSDVFVMPTPPFDYFLSKQAKTRGSSFVRLRQIKASANDITDVDEWFLRNNLPKLPTLPVRNPETHSGADKKMPAYIPESYKRYPPILAIENNEHIFVTYGSGYNGRYLAILSKTSKETEYVFDFEKYIIGHGIFTDGSITWATIDNNILYASTGHRTYASSSDGKNAYITAIDLRTKEILWRSMPLVSNTENFVIHKDTIITGYGFTEEPDFLFVLNKWTGQIMQKIKVKTGPEIIAEKDNKIFVRTYDMDYEYAIQSY